MRKTSFTIFRVKNGWIVQTYNGSVGYNHTDNKDRQSTYVFTNVMGLAQFLAAATKE